MGRLLEIISGASVMSDLNDQHHDQFLRLFAEHEPALRTFVRSLLPSLADASEVMQEVAVVLWQKFAEFDATRDFRKWAFGVARYEALAHLRDQSKGPAWCSVMNSWAGSPMRAQRPGSGMKHSVRRWMPVLQKLPETAAHAGARGLHQGHAHG